MLAATWDNFTYILDDPVFVYTINNGLTEPYTRELQIVKDYLQEHPSSNNTCIDIGGHIGTTSFAYSRLFKNIITFEPNPTSYDFFCKNMRLNSINNVTVHHKGVYNKSMHCRIVKHSGGNSGCYYIQECEKNENSIEVVRLDDLNIERVDFMKVDTEGSELFVLEGALDLISKNKPLIQVETNNCSLDYFGYDKERIFEFMKQQEYKLLSDNGANPFFITNDALNACH